MRTSCLFFFRPTRAARLSRLLTLALGLGLPVTVQAQTAQAQKAPWGLTQMQFGPQLSSSKYSSEWTHLGNPCYARNNNVAMGLNGRLQFSLLDMFLYSNEDKAPGKAPFRLADVWAFESGLGYLRDKRSQSDQVSAYEKVHNTLWYSLGLDFGVVALYRVLPALDVGIRYAYLGRANSAFGQTAWARQDNGDLIDTPVRSNSSSSFGGNAWGGVVRVGRFYAEVNRNKGDDLASTVRTYARPTTTFDLKYRYADRTKTWVPYVGMQVGTGSTNLDSYDGPASVTRNWVQVSIGKMTNY